MWQVHAEHRRWYALQGRGTLPTFRVVVFPIVLAALLAVSGCTSSVRSGGFAPGSTPATATAGPPTFTPGPPTPTPTAQERRFTALAQQAAGSLVLQVEATYDAAGRTVIVSTTVGGSVPNGDAEISAAQERVKSICFQIEEALWTSGTPLRQVTVTVTGPILDQYADATTGPYGAAVLTATTAAKLTWSALTPDAAWEKYDNVFLRTDFNDTD